MGKYLDSSGITHLWSRIKTYIASLGYTSNTGTVTGITMNNTSYSPVNGDVDIGTVITSHQDISGKANTADLATVATSGSYTDLSDKPTISTVTFREW